MIIHDNNLVARTGLLSLAVWKPAAFVVVALHSFEIASIASGASPLSPARLLLRHPATFLRSISLAFPSKVVWKVSGEHEDWCV